MTRELLARALDALETILSSKPVRDLDETICAIRTHLAAPQPEAYRMPEQGWVRVEAGDKVALLINPAAPAVPTDHWKAAIDDELVCCHIGTTDSFPDARTALKNLIDWHVSVALDPAVSSDAQALIDKGKSAAPAVPADEGRLNAALMHVLSGKSESAAPAVPPNPSLWLPNESMKQWGESWWCYESMRTVADQNYQHGFAHGVRFADESLTAKDIMPDSAQSAAPAVREPQDERIRWRDAVIKEAESALRTAEQEFADMPTWANVGHAAKKVTHALAVIAALGIGGGGNG